MKKNTWYIIGGVVVVLVVLFFMFGFTAPDEDAVRAEINEGENLAGESAEAGGFEGETMMIAMETSSFEFEGFGPGKSHVGTFDSWEGELFLEGGAIVGFSGVIQADSVNTGIGGLDAHLKRDDFFDVAVYPEIRFEGMIADGVATGDLDFHGVVNEISFPVEVSESGVSTDFVLDTTPFGMTNAGVNKEVRIAFELVK